MFFADDSFVAIPYDYSIKGYRDVLERMYPFNVRQFILTSRNARNLIEHYGKQKYCISLSFETELSLELMQTINGYLHRIFTESIEPLRLSDITHLIGLLQSLYYEDEVDIDSLCFEGEGTTFVIFQNGRVEVSSGEQERCLKELVLAC
ncbi:hypothetical protein PP175_26405 (plasmid) [Aneurinibacillus sp. Ricciae_BoGa-3]|uniref:hypothetical protein n=1 Tax=Aneurinibacillus sp. Ricciae_BoGa-3 TaxID=3022697 RepID=UPI0023427B74|nr:hypothetical protein [Aneurinibacillus sp. Ricciae_BoGa-3]WCK57600.1 hypothetical protein PP175_26405 [Aneurinibacillus sp. Ricciae_BoGa-3]